MRIAGIPSTVLVAPDSFKGTFTAAQVAAAMGCGIESAGHPAELCPVADGGEGTLAALGPALAAQTAAATVHDPLGRPITAIFGLARDRAVAVVEIAAASGLGLLAPEELDPLGASTFGSGELIASALDRGAEVVLVGVGGSATTDGGAGAIRAIEQRGGLRGARLVVLCDVRTAFEDAARVFGAQKGADADEARRLTRRLHTLARRHQRDPRGVPMTGAAGGLAGGLWAAFGAELVPGAAFILDALGFDARMRGARAVVTGEGKLDEQSLAGKAISEIATRARQSGVPCHAVVGRRELDAFGLRMLDLQGVVEARTLEEIEAAACALADMM